MTNYDLLHPHMRESFREYIEAGIRPGSFMYALLANDLRHTLGRADDINRHQIHDYVSWLWNYAPSGCWGSPERVDAWLAMHAKTRAETEARRS